MSLETVTTALFQADDEGSIPFTRFNNRLLAQTTTRVARRPRAVDFPAAGRTPSERFPRVFPQLLGEIPPLFTPKGWGKREHPAQKVPILRGFHGGRDRD
jgi:hypothetical protein